MFVSFRLFHGLVLSRFFLGRSCLDVSEIPPGERVVCKVKEKTKSSKVDIDYLFNIFFHFLLHIC